MNLIDKINKKFNEIKNKEITHHIVSSDKQKMRLYFNDGSKSKVFHPDGVKRFIEIYNYPLKITDIRLSDSRDPPGVGKVAVTFNTGSVRYGSIKPTIARYPGRDKI